MELHGSRNIVQNQIPQVEAAELSALEKSFERLAFNLSINPTLGKSMK